MFRQNFCMILLAVLSFPVLSSSQSKVGEQCCFEDWENEVGKFLEVFKINSMDFSVPGFVKQADRWRASFETYFLAQMPEGICRGQPNLKCNKTTKLCECNDMAPFKYVKNGNDFCVGGRGDLCLNTFRAVWCKNKYFKCVPNPAWSEGRFERKFFNFCKTTYRYFKLSLFTLTQIASLIRTPLQDLKI